MKIYTMLFFAFLVASIHADVNTFTFIADSTSYTAQYTFKTQLNADSALSMLYEFEHFQKYARGVNQIKMTSSTDSSYEMENALRVPFYTLRVHVSRKLNRKKRQMDFRVDNFRQSPRLLPSVVFVEGMFQVKEEPDGTQIILWQHSQNGSRISFFYKRLLEKRLKAYFLAIEEYLALYCHHKDHI